MNILNKKTLDLIKSFEGLELKAYKDSVGVWTIGYGHTNSAGLPKVIPGQMITETEALQMLSNDLKKYEAPVQRLVKVPLTDNQYGALVSFTYNLGEGNFSGSTLLKKVNAKDFKGATQEFAKWNKAGGKVLAGLTRRRAAEAALFASQEVTQPIPVVPSVVVPETPKPSVQPSVATPEALTNSRSSILEAILKILSAIFGGKNAK